MFRSASSSLHLVALVCVAAVIAALVSQHVFDMQPCAWCVFQRMLFLLIAAVCWLGVLLGKVWTGGYRLAASLAFLLALGGVASAWYQYSIASNLFSCNQTFADQFMVASGLDAGLPWLFGIYATCADARVNLLGIEYALWSLGLFVLVGIAALRRIGK